MKRATMLVLLVALAGAAGAEAPRPPVPTTYEYRGHEVPAMWFNLQYAYFKDKIACVDGKFYDVGKTRAWMASGHVDDVPVVTQTPPAVGEARVSGLTPRSSDPNEVRRARGATIRRVIGDNEALVTPSPREPWVHVRGIEPKNLVDGAPFWDTLLIYVGTHQYVDADGVKHNVQSFVVYQPITREQFAEALAGGFELVRYKIIVKKVPETRVPGMPRIAPPEESEMVGRPVPVPAGAPPVTSPATSG